MSEGRTTRARRGLGPLWRGLGPLWRGLGPLWRRLVGWVFATDHKVIGIRALWSGIVFLAIGGGLAMVLRWQRAFPGEPVPVVGSILFPGADGAVTPPAYTALFTSHGLFMIFFAVTPILIGGIGTFVVPLAIGSRGVALPRVAGASFWLVRAAQILALVSLAAPSAPSAGWTMYPPLASGEGAPGIGQTLMIVAILLIGCGTTGGSLSLITTVVVRRAPGMTWLRLPMTVWGLWLAAVLTALFAPILAAATGLLLLDRVAGTAVFAGGHGDPILYQHLFWIFGHPEVYILILPVWGMVGDFVAFFSRRPAFWYRGSVLAMVSVASMSGLVYGHHMFRAGLAPMIGAGFELLTLAISAPATVLLVNWLATLWRGSIRPTLPMLFALGTIAVLGVGGLSGLFLGSITLDIYLHDTMWVVGHFHLIMAAATLMGSFAAIHFWFPKMTGRELGRRLGLAHFWGTLSLALLTFGGMLAVGYAGQPRRYYDTADFAFLAGARDLDRWVSYAGFTLGAVQLLFFANLIGSWRRGRPADSNPWQAPTLEWSIPSPAPRENYASPPVVGRGPYELGVAETASRSGRDWIGQWEAADEEEPSPLLAPYPTPPPTTRVSTGGEPAPARRPGDAEVIPAPAGEPGRAASPGDADLAAAVGLTVFLTAWTILCGALLLASFAARGSSSPAAWPPWSPAFAAALAALIASAGLLFARPSRARFAAAAALAGFAAVAELGGRAAWPAAWPPSPAAAPLVLLGAVHIASVAGGVIALVRAARRPPAGHSLARWYAVALAAVWLLVLAAGTP